MPSILFEVKNNIGFITLNRPEKLNSFNREMSLGLQAVLDDCQGENIRAVYITGVGKSFSAGQDLEEVTGAASKGLRDILSEQLNPIVIRIRKLEKPVIAAVNGVAAGAGANIALSCDIVVASSTASFIQAFSKIGLIPDSGGTFILPRLVGWQKASALMMLGEKVSAQDAEKMGMIFKVMDEENFTDHSTAIATQLAQMPTKALAYTKQMLIASFNNSFEEQIHLEDLVQQKAGATEDFREGVRAFLEKRKPLYRGI
jgi:2-(1,2-epoxy-1,2-dihydrophenyl)acetyl-CoA isomerase